MGDIVDRLLSLSASELKNRRSKILRRRRSYSRTKGHDWSRAELAAYLRKNDFRSRQQLRAGRVGDDPTSYDYEKVYGSWGNAMNDIWRDGGVVFDRAFVAKALAQFKLWSVRAYRKAQAERPDILPSLYAIRREFGSWEILKEIAGMMSMRETICRYVELKEKLGKRPTRAQCRSAGVVIDEAVEFYGSKKALDEFIKGLEEVV